MKTTYGCLINEFIIGDGMEHIQIEVEGRNYDCCVTCVGEPLQTKYGIILTHGAGGDMNHTQLVAIAENLAEDGYLVIRFTCKGLNLGYRTKVLKGILSYVMKSYSHLKGYFIGGRSMGSRSSISVSCDKTLSDTILGVISLSYPLHKPQACDKIRDEPLFEITKPILFISGTTDNMCKQELFQPILDHMTTCEVHWVEGANHGLDVQGKDTADVIQEICHVIVTWLQNVVNSQSKRKKSQSFVKTKKKKK